MPNIDDHIVCFQCPHCGFELQQTVDLLKAEQRIVCSCKVAINIDATRSVSALHAAVLPGPNEITVKFFR